MTVQELIAKLEEMPPDSNVVYDDGHMLCDIQEVESQAGSVILI